MDNIEEVGIEPTIIDQSELTQDAAPTVDEVYYKYLSVEMEKVDKSWPATLKQIFVVVKSAAMICIALHAAYKWRKSKHPMGKAAQLLLIFNALIVLGVCVYKFTSKEIAPLFLLQATSHYSVFCVFHALLAYV